MWKRATGSSGQRLGRVTSVHLTETCEEDLPNEVTHVATRDATVADTELLEPIHTHLAERDLLPAEHQVDAGYSDAGMLVTAASCHHVDVLGPVRVDTNWQARQGQGFAAECFKIDWEAKGVTCPQGKRSASWKERVDHLGHDVIDSADLLGRLQVLSRAQHLYPEEERFTNHEMAASSAMLGAVRGSSTPTDTGISGAVCEAGGR
jgi:hypothetical protein